VKIWPDLYLWAIIAQISLNLIADRDLDCDDLLTRHPDRCDFHQNGRLRLLSIMQCGNVSRQLFSALWEITESCVVTSLYTFLDVSQGGPVAIFSAYERRQGHLAVSTPGLP
jgi:hypothetical protein